MNKNRFSNLKWLAGAGFLVVSLFTFSPAAKAQDDTEAKFGIKGGINLSNLYVKDVTDEKTKLGFNAGVWAKIPVAELFAFQPEVLLTSAGTKIGRYNNAQGTNQINFSLTYIQVPLLASLTAGPISFQAGPYVSYLVSAQVKNLRVSTDGVPTNDPNGTNKTVELNRDNFNTVDYGLAGGLALDIKGFQLGARYNYGLRNVGQSLAAKYATNGAKNSVAQIFIGFGF